jgi:hypothetical protein
MNFTKTIACLFLAIPLWNAAWAESPTTTTQEITITASTEESDKGNVAAKAFDGDPATRWSASSDAVDEWLRFDFGQPQKLGGIEIDWQFPDQQYACNLEGSTDGAEWKQLAQAKSNAGEKRVKLAETYSSLRIKMTNLPDDKWASITEVRLFDAEGKQIKNSGIKKPVTLTASSEESEEGHTAAKAFDGSKDTRWCASSDMLNEWLRMDFDKPRAVGVIEIDWEFPEEDYGSTIQGSQDGKEWVELSTFQSKTAEKRIRLAGTYQAVRIKVTSLPEDKWASIAEVRLFDADEKPIK